MGGAWLLFVEGGGGGAAAGWESCAVSCCLGAWGLTAVSFFYRAVQAAVQTAQKQLIWRHALLHAAFMSCL